MGSRNSRKEQVVGIRRRGGKLREIETSLGRRFVLLGEPRNERFLEVGFELDASDIDELNGSLAVSAGLSIAYRLLTVRDRTEREIRHSLAERGLSSAAIDEVVRVLRKRGYLDDRKLASAYIRYVTEHKPCGPRLVRQRLERMGVADDVIEEEVSAELPARRERALALEVARERLKPGMERTRAVRRINALLLRRGFSAGIVNDICARILSGRELTGSHDERED